MKANEEMTFVRFTLGVWNLKVSYHFQVNRRTAEPAVLPDDF